MLEPGRYVVWFRTPYGAGTGTIELRDGLVTGRDAMLAYDGTYVIEGEHFRATIKTHRYAAGQPSVFGIDDLDITLTGRTAQGGLASCAGRAKQAPDLPFEATLIQVQK